MGRTGTLEGQILLGRPKRWWVDNIKINLEDIEWDSVDWIGLAQDRDKCTALVNSVMNLWFPEYVGKLSSSYTTGGFSITAQLHTVSQSY
jgi:hypothetical protein